MSPNSRSTLPPSLLASAESGLNVDVTTIVWSSYAGQTLKMVNDCVPKGASSQPACTCPAAVMKPRTTIELSSFFVVIMFFPDQHERCAVFNCIRLVLLLASRFSWKKNQPKRYGYAERTSRRRVKTLQIQAPQARRQLNPCVLPASQRADLLLQRVGQCRLGRDDLKDTGHALPIARLRGIECLMGTVENLLAGVHVFRVYRQCLVIGPDTGRYLQFSIAQAGFLAFDLSLRAAHL